MNTGVDLETLAFHEAGHAVVARLFEENLYLDEMVVSPTAEMEQGKQLGSIGVRPKEELGLSLSFVSLAGMLAEHIWKNHPTKVLSNKQTILANLPQFVNTKLSGGDFPIFYRDMSINCHKYAASETEYQNRCVGFLIDFLCDSNVWLIVERLAKEVQKKKNLSLDKNELETIFTDSQIDSCVKKHKESLLIRFKLKTAAEIAGDKLQRIIDTNDLDIFNMD